MIKNYKMVLQYDGSRYDGWQKQGNTGNTLQGKLEGILLKLTGRPGGVYRGVYRGLYLSLIHI